MEKNKGNEGEDEQILTGISVTGMYYILWCVISYVSEECTASIVKDEK